MKRLLIIATVAIFGYGVITQTPVDRQDRPRHPNLSRQIASSETIGEAQKDVTASSSFINSKTHEGEVLAADLPATEQIKNIGSKVDGAGMCVMSSIEMAARWQGLESMRGLRDWCARQPGGGYPSKVDEQIKAFCAQKNQPVPDYINADNLNGDGIKAILDPCDQTGRIACITYGFSPRYGKAIQHMTCVVKEGGKYGVVLDNNFIGDNAYEWMTPDELVRRIQYPNGKGWVFVWLAPPPPPVPHN